MNSVLRFPDLSLRWWPVFLIALGGYMLYVRIAGDPSETAAPPREVRHEQ